MVHQYVPYERPWACHIDFILWSTCVLYAGFGYNGFMTKAQPINGHYKTNIINGVGHPRSDSVMPLELCTVVCNSWSTGIILQVPRDSTNPAENGLKCRVDYI